MTTGKLATCGALRIYSRRNQCKQEATGICIHRNEIKEFSMLADFGKKVLLGLLAAACLVGMHAAVVYSITG